MRRNNTAELAKCRWASSTSLSTFRICARRTVRRKRTFASAGCALSQISITRLAIQSFIDELGHAAGQDPIEYWLAALGDPRKIDFEGQNAKYSNYGKPLAIYPLDTGRLRRVVEVVAERSGWANKKPGNGRALGFAAHRSFLNLCCGGG